jgi:hypothetical protein
MKAKIKRGRAYRPLLKYLFEGSKDPAHSASAKLAHVIGGSVYGSQAQLLAQFSKNHELKPEVEKPVWHCSLSWVPGETVSDERMSEVATAFMKKMGFPDDAVWTVIRHHDTETKTEHRSHCHIVASRISRSGKLWYGQRDVHVAIQATQELEREFNMVVTAGLEERDALTVGDDDHDDFDPDGAGAKRKSSRAEKEKSKREARASGKSKPEATSREQMAAAIDQALKGKPKVTLLEFLERLEEKGIEVRVSAANNGTISGLSYAMSGHKASWKGSDLGKGFSWKGLQARVQPIDDARDKPALLARATRRPISKAEALERQTLEGAVHGTVKTEGKGGASSGSASGGGKTLAEASWLKTVRLESGATEFRFRRSNTVAIVDQGDGTLKIKGAATDAKIKVLVARAKELGFSSVVVDHHGDASYAMRVTAALAEANISVTNPELAALITDAYAPPRKFAVANPITNQPKEQHHEHRNEGPSWATEDRGGILFRHASEKPHAGSFEPLSDYRMRKLQECDVAQDGSIGRRKPGVEGLVFGDALPGRHPHRDLRWGGLTEDQVRRTLAEYCEGRLLTKDELGLVQELQTAPPPSLPGARDLYREQVDALLAKRASAVALTPRELEMVRLELERREHIERQGLGVFDEDGGEDRAAVEHWLQERQDQADQESVAEEYEALRSAANDPGAPGIGSERYETPEKPRHGCPYEAVEWTGHRGGGHRVLYRTKEGEHRNRLALSDCGDRILVHPERLSAAETEQAIREALRIGVGRWQGEGALVITGDAEFQALVARIAAEEGLSGNLANRRLAAQGTVLAGKATQVRPAPAPAAVEEEATKPRRRIGG